MWLFYYWQLISVSLQDWAFPFSSYFPPQFTILSDSTSRGCKAGTRVKSSTAKQIAYSLFSGFIAFLTSLVIY